jgi:transcriptional regulator with XRE-family HTH domain
MALSQKLANNLKKRRGNTSQIAYARKLGISQPTLNRLENAGQNTTLNTLEQLTKALKCDICDLFK